MSLHFNIIFKSICGSSLNYSCLSGSRFEKKTFCTTGLNQWCKTYVIKCADTPPDVSSDRYNTPTKRQLHSGLKLTILLRWSSFRKH